MRTSNTKTNWMRLRSTIAWKLRIIPTYYAKNSKGYSPDWIQYLFENLSAPRIAPDYTMKRMLDDYEDRFYHKLATRSAHISANNYENR